MSVLHEQTALLLLTTAHRLAIEAAEELEFEHVSVMGLMAVQIIDRAPCSPRDLAAALGCSRPAVTQQINRLVRDELVERTADTHDGRAKVLSLTRSGEVCGRFAAEALERCMRSFTSELGDDERTALRSLLERVERGADWHRGQRLFSAWRRPVGACPPAIHVR